MLEYYVYILTNKNNNVLYIGVTNDLSRRVYEHKEKVIKGFTSKYNVNKLVYFDTTSDVYEALVYEKKLKRWRREWKNELIEATNPNWEDLSKLLE